MTMLSTPLDTDNVEALRDHPDVQPLIAGWYAGTVGRREFLTHATVALGSLAAATTLLSACGGDVQTVTPAPPTATTNGAAAPSRAASSGSAVAPASSGSAVAPTGSGSAVAPATTGSAVAATRAPSAVTTGSATAPVTAGSAAAPTATRVPASPATSGSAVAPATTGSAAAGPAMPAPIVATGVAAADVNAKMVQFKNGTVNIIAYEARPKNMTGPLPAVIVIHENQGLTDHIKDVTRRLAREGFIGLGVDYLSHDGGTLAFNTLQDATTAINKLTDEQIISDSNAAIQYLTANGGTKVGVVGFCWGGRRSLLTAENNPVSAAVVFYGPIAPPDNVQTKDTLGDAAKDMCPVLGNFGGLNPIIPAAKIQQLQQALQAAGKTADFKIYPEAGHAFNNDTRPFNNNVGYVASAAQDAWGRTLAWFRKYLV